MFCFRCIIKCNVCLTDTCGVAPAHEQHCPDCNRTCSSHLCFQLHKQRGTNIISGVTFNSQCEKYIMCVKYNVLYDKIHRSLAIHQCGEWQCKYCHQFFIGKILLFHARRRNETSELKHLYFDFKD